MAKIPSPSVLDKMKPGINLLETIGAGLDLVKGLFSEVSYPNWMALLNKQWIKQESGLF